MSWFSNKSKAKPRRPVRLGFETLENRLVPSTSGLEWMPTDQMPTDQMPTDQIEVRMPTDQKDAGHENPGEKQGFNPQPDPPGDWFVGDPTGLGDRKSDPPSEVGDPTGITDGTVGDPTGLRDGMAVDAFRTA